MSAPKSDVLTAEPVFQTHLDYQPVNVHLTIMDSAVNKVSITFAYIAIIRSYMTHI